ncbi:MAG: hypothetical protein ACOX5J_06550 [Candidatus Hydrogenedentales bacterium]
MVITPGAVADDAKRLCLLPGDQITRINDTRITDSASFSEALSTFILDMDEPPRDKLEIFRAGTPVELNFIFYPQIEIEQPVTLSREAAGECINYLEDVLILGIEQLLRVNQDMSTRLGEPVSTRDSLNGLWIPPETGDQGPAILEMLGIAVGDRILSLNGTRIESLSQFEEFIRAAQSKLATNDPIRLDATIERGEFQVVKLTIEVT